VPISTMNRLEPQTGCALIVRAGEALEIVSPRDEQVADLALYVRADPREYFSAGRTLDYNERVFLTTGSTLYSNRSTPMMRIELDDAGRHDYLLTPCSGRMFQILHNLDGHPSCQDNLSRALQPFNISYDDIHATFNAFMRVDIHSNGSIAVMPPSSRGRDRVVLRALLDLIVGLTACSSEHSNNGVCKPIDYRVIASTDPESKAA
jgi:uncharacterized protein YcgI (DUF1989 family)